jgi:hypothetical protein
LLKYDPDAESSSGMHDGIFWMNHESFIANFKYLYICRILSELTGWNKLTLQGEWTGMSCGYPGKPMLVNVPQYKLKIFQPGQYMIELKQTGDSAVGTTTFKGKNTIAWMLSDEDGKKMKKLSKRNVVARTPVTDLVVLTNPVIFNKNQSYPKTYTLLCGSAKFAPDGEGTY